MLKGYGSEKIIVGYDLGWDFAQISYCGVESGKVETVTSVAGTQTYSIPVVLCKRPGVNQWYYGQEALRYAQENGGILVENLMQLAVDEEPVLIEETQYDPLALLTLFFKRSLGLLTGITGLEKIEAMMITCDRVDGHLTEMLEKLAANLRLKTDRIEFQSHQESYYYYMLHQPIDLWREPSVLFDYNGGRMGFMQLEINKRTQPIVVLIRQEDDEFPARASLEEQGDEGYQILDREFLKLTQEKLGDNRIASVFLIGDDFSEKWLKSSLKFLCEGSRIFLGNNLFSKGACLAMLEKFQPSEMAGKYVFLGEDKLKSNVGMKFMRRGEETYLALMDAGVNWFQAKAGLDFYLREEKELEITITDLTGRGIRQELITLDQLPGDIARMRLEAYLQEEKLLVVTLEDLGFGEYRTAEGRKWRREIRLD